MKHPLTSSCFYFQSRALNGVCEKTVQATSDPSKSELSCLEEVHITNVKPREGLVSYNSTDIIIYIETISAAHRCQISAEP